MNLTFRSRAPLRLGLAGGGTDVAPYCDLFGGYVLNATIDRYAYSVLQPLEEKNVQFIASDLQKELTLDLESNYLLDGNLDLHKAVYNYFIQNFANFRKDLIKVW